MSTTLHKELKQTMLMLDGPSHANQHMDDSVGVLLQSGRQSERLKIALPLGTIRPQ